MKAVVVEIRENMAAVLSDDGCVTKVKNRNYMIGQVIAMNEITAGKRKRLAIWAAAAAALILVSGGSAYAYYSPYSYVSLDVNPSIEYTLNRFDRVLQIKGVNDDGEQLLKEIDLKSLSHKKIEQALSETVEQIKNDGFFDGTEEGGIVIATSGKDLKKAERLADRLQKCAEDATSDKNVEVEASEVTQERIAKARELGVTPGKLNLVEKLQESAAQPDDVHIEEWLDKPVKDIMKEIKTNRKASKDAAPEDGDGGQSSDESETSVPEAVTSAPELSSEPGQTGNQGKKETGKTEQKPHADEESSGETEEQTESSVEKSESKADKNTDKDNKGNDKAAQKSSSKQGKS